jgi:hypothetical protein
LCQKPAWPAGRSEDRRPKLKRIKGQRKNKEQ